MKIQTIITFVNKSEPKEIEFNTLEPIDIGGIELDGYGAIKYLIGTINKENQVNKVLVSHKTPDSKIKEYRSQMIPKLITLSTTNKFEYNGISRTTDIPSKLRELMPSASKEVIETCFNLFDNIQLTMDKINTYMKQYKPTNATLQGYIRHHFPSPKFPESSKN